MNEEEIGTTDRNGNIVLAPVCLVHKAKKTKGITIGCINKNNNENTTVDEKGYNNNMNNMIITTAYKNMVKSINNVSKIKNAITISSVGESLPLSGVISIETTG